MKICDTENKWQTNYIWPFGVYIITKTKTKDLKEIMGVLIVCGL